MAADKNSLEFEIRLATQQFLAALQKLESSYGGTMKAVAGESSTAASALEQSFKVLGVKGVQAVEQEVQQLQAALAQIRNAPDVLPADKAAAVAAFNQRLAEVRGQAQQTPPALAGVGQAAEGAAGSLASAAHKAVAWTAALAGISSAGDLVGQLVATGSEFENVRVRLENLLGGTEKAQAAFGMIKDLAASTPFEVAGLTESFIKLTAMGMQPTEAQMRSLVDVASNLGGGTETLSGVTLALGQAWAKGKLQGEEIMQLAERGVPVWDALARATGRTVPELQRMSEAGALGRDVIGQLIDELGRMNAGASDKLMNTYAGAVANAKDALAEFYDMVAQSGVLEFLTDKVRELLAEFDRMKQTGELQAKAKALADTFISTAMTVETVVKALAGFGPQIKLVAEAALALKAANMAGTLLSMASGAVAASTGMTAVGAASGAAAGQMAVATTAATGLATAVRVLRSLTGIGLALGVAELVQEFFRAKRAAEEGDAAVKKMLEEKPVNGPKKAAEAATQAIGQTVSKSDDLVKQFDVLVEKGDTAAEALAKIGKDFDLASAAGIHDAAVVLDSLVAQGKITATQFRDAWTVALKDVNLNEFEVRARQALEGASEGAVQLQQALDAGLREAIRRAGGDFDVLAGGMGKAAQSAVADVDFMIANLGRLKDQGVDTGAALVQSLGKAITTADSQAAIEALRTRIEAVRAQLGDKIADGLLDQAKDKANALKDALDKATPGINSVREAMKQLGITSDEELKKVAASAKDAYDTLTASGTASARELAEAFKKSADAAIAANNGIAPSWVQGQAAVRGYRVEVDAAGKATLVSADAVHKAGRAHDQTAKSVDTHRSALERLNAEKEREIAAQEKANDLATRALKLEEAKRAAGTITNADAVPSFESNEQANAWLAEWEKQYAKKNPFSTRSAGSLGSFQRQTTLAEWQAEVDAMALRNTMKGNGNASQSSQTPLESMRSGQTITINLQQNGRGYGQLRTDAAGAATLQAFLRDLERGKEVAQ
ncbi:hypothetical protein BA022_09255 [Diaphorobacter nitroreducens]|uniref:tape measure protein n=1 Tax=Diaphorobacter nitroreducens TaxID=164759 RepID=UPI000B5987B4|nr:tape measure protein [Diaphorobacter nitroreducens]ASI68709.1 hypothetical protein BA022_09255 [Diaphorobacter nitroreducens]